MSRGPGRIERVIEALFVSSPSRTFSTDELVAAAFPGVNRTEKKHRVAVLRAADKVAKRRHWGKWQCERIGQGGYWELSLKGRGSVYINLLDLRSYALGRLRSDYAHKSLAQLEAMLDDPADQHAKYLVRGGAWWLHVEEAKVKLAGGAVEPELQQMLDAQKAAMEATATALTEMFGGSAEERERRHWAWEANEHGKICGHCGREFAPDEAVVRASVIVRRQNPLGRSTATELELRCLDCMSASVDGDFKRMIASLYGWQKTRCATCRRTVHQRYRANRKQTFCCQDCKHETLT
jgi:hypothetical protein